MKTFLLFAFSIALSQFTLAQEKKIIFVCEHGAAKSVIAASYFNKLAKERKLGYVAECRGTFPDSVVSPGTKAGLSEDNLFDSRIQPRKLLASDTADVERIILFTPMPANVKTSIKTEDWSHIENVDAEYPKRRDAIVKKINALLDSLPKQ